MVWPNSYIFSKHVSSEKWVKLFLLFDHKIKAHFLSFNQQRTYKFGIINDSEFPFGFSYETNNARHAIYRTICGVVYTFRFSNFLVAPVHSSSKLIKINTWWTFFTREFNILQNFEQHMQRNTHSSFCTASGATRMCKIFGMIISLFFWLLIRRQTTFATAVMRNDQVTQWNEGKKIFNRITTKSRFSANTTVCRLQTTCIVDTEQVDKTFLH